ncbi:MAG: AsmA family protein [Alphaproteobacteria bacterium]|nr:AsmA family protein [Alphaproteobacteria bacterium]
MKKFLLTFMAIVILVIGTVAFFFYKSFDEASYKEQIIASAKELTGKQMVINGDFSFQLLPAPVIQISDVLIKNEGPADVAGIIKVAKIEAHLKLSSLFKNPLIVEKLTLEEPQIQLKRDEKGQNNWNFKFLKPEETLQAQDAMMGQTFKEVPPQFKNMEIKNGTISYSDAVTNEKYQITVVSGLLQSKSVTGPFDFEGLINIDKLPLKTNLHLDQLNLSSDTKFSLNLLNQDSGAVFSVAQGTINKIGDITQSISGNVTFSIPKLSSFLATYRGFKDLPEQLNKKIEGNGNFFVSQKEFSISEAAIRYGEDAVENSMSVKLTTLFPEKKDAKSKVSAMLVLSHLNLDTFYPYLPKNESWQNILSIAQNKLPENLDLLVKSSQVSLFKEQIKDFVFSFDKQNENVEIRELKAVLPKATYVSSKGNILLDTTEPTILLTTTIESDSPTQTLSWLDLSYRLDIETTFINKLKASSDIRLRNKDLTFSQLNIGINDASVAGGMAFALTEPKLTGYVNLAIKNMDFDKFVPYTPVAENRSVKLWLSDVKNALEKSVLLKDINVSFSLNGSDITFKSLPMERINYEGKINQKEWITDNLTIDQVALSNLKYTGTVQKKDDGSLQFKDVYVELEMPKSMLLLDRLKIQSPLPANMGNLTLNAKFNGSFDKVNTDMQLSFSQGKITAVGDIENPLKTNTSYSGTLKITHPNFRQFVQMVKPDLQIFPALSGTFTFNGWVSGDASNITFKDSEAVIGPQKITANIQIQKDEMASQIKGNVKTPYLYLDKFMSSKNLNQGVDAKTGKTTFSSNLLNFDDFNGLTINMQLEAEKMALGKLEVSNLKTPIKLEEKILSFNDATAQIADGTVNVNVNLNASGATPYVKGTLKLQKVPVRMDLITLGLFRLKSGTSSLSMNFDASGNSVEDMINSLSSTGSFTVQSGIISNLNLNAFEHRIRATLARQDSLTGMDKQLNKELTFGETAFDILSGNFSISDGVFKTSDTVLKTPNANAMMQINFDLPKWSVNATSAISLKNFAGYPPISVVVKGLAHNPQTNIDLSSFIRYIEGTSNDAKAKLLQDEQTAKAAQARLEAKERINQLAQLVVTAENQIAQTEQLLQTTSTQTALTELVRAKDALVLLRELANKPAPSVADVEKGTAQSALIASRTQSVSDEIKRVALSQLREEIQSIETSAQKTMHAVNRIEQRLKGVEQIDQAYQKAFSTMTLIQQLKTFANTSADIEQIKTAIVQAKDAFEILELTYESISKFDIDVAMPASTEPSSGFQGSIRRN